MRPGTYDLKLYHGDTYRYRFTCYSSTGNADLTGVTAKAEIRAASGGAVLATPRCTVTQPNIIDMVIDTPMWATLRGGVWDLQLTYASTTPPSVVTIIAGTVTVTPDVTDSATMVGFARGVARVQPIATTTD